MFPNPFSCFLRCSGQNNFVVLTIFEFKKEKNIFFRQTKHRKIYKYLLPGYATHSVQFSPFHPTLKL